MSAPPRSSIPSLATPLPTTTAKGSSVGGAAVASPLTITAANNHLSVSVDWGPPLDVVLFPTDVANGGSVSKTTADIANELKNNALPNAGLDATASQTGDVLTIQSNSTGMDSAVSVTPASSSDASKDLRLGRAFGGTEVSGSADKRPAVTAAPAPFAGGSDGSPVTPADFVPAGGTGGIYSLDELLLSALQPALPAGSDLGRRRAGVERARLRPRAARLPDRRQPDRRVRGDSA